MFLVTVNKAKQVLFFSFIGNVTADQLVESHDEVARMINDLKPGFRVLTDMGRLDSVSVDCGVEIGKTMELCDQNGVELIVRVIPDPKKDIGLSILSLFHYSRRPRTVTCESMVEAAKVLSL